MLMPVVRPMTLFLVLDFVAGCKSSNSAESIFMVSMGALGMIRTADSVQRATSYLPPYIGECLGSVNASFLLETISPSLREPACAKAYATAVTLQADVTVLTSSTSQNISSSTVFSTVCTSLSDLVPCLDYSVFPSLLSVVANESCCSPLFDATTANFGSNLTALLTTFLHHVSDVICSTQSFPNDAKQPTCGSTFVESFLAPAARDNPWVLLMNALNAIQIPNDQGVAAMSGFVFRSTINTTKPAIFTKPFLPDSCVQPVDTLLTWIRSFPLLKTPWFGLYPSQLFEDNDCMPGDVVLDLLGDSYHPFLTGISTLINGSCFHLANGYSQLLPTISKLNLFSTSRKLLTVPASTIATPQPTLSTPNVRSTSPSTPFPFTLGLFIFLAAIWDLL
ncbi:hypothetical protein AeMF1_010561 [Aphanomyces euteiches]|nr:hypothetical protein AeMF1_010561 [Aphanomyces euteiches]KAH9187233.1 hypothetical protein AeNC1_010787 [Aphanomyces euteiches]